MLEAQYNMCAVIAIYKVKLVDVDPFECRTIDVLNGEHVLHSGKSCSCRTFLAMQTR